MHDHDLLEDADRRGRDYVASAGTRRVFPDDTAIAGLTRFAEVLPESGTSPAATIALLDDVGAPATVASTGGRYFGFVIGGTLPVAAAAERLALAWDQCASSFDNSPVADAIEQTAARWALDILELPAASAVNFGTSATACGLACLTAARRALLARRGWDFDRDGLAGAPPVRVVIGAAAHITVRKALRLMGVGTANIIEAPVDAHGRIDPEQLPPLDASTLLCLQAGEVNTGESDDFATIIPRARAAGAWVHVDGAFGLWTRASATRRVLTEGVEAADSWTVDGHKWLNTPYDGAMGICRDASALSAAMNSDASYATAPSTSQKNLGIEFSRRARGIPIWAALRTLGRSGVADLVDRHCTQARRLATGLSAAGYSVLNRVVMNQVLVRLESDEATRRVREAAVASGETWFGLTTWNGRVAFRLSVSSWATTDHDIDATIALLGRLRNAPGRSSATEAAG
jgi:glutamate/tyrosine decarboxylase-like PLP-dependent enzyme